MGQRLRGLILARPGRVCDGLRALLTAIPEICCVEQANDTSSVPLAILEQQPDFVVLEFSSAGNELQAVLPRIRAEAPQIRCLVLADDVLEQKLAEAHGADGVLLKGFTAEKLVEIVRRLLSAPRPSGR